jgi:hypothetical protein
MALERIFEEIHPERERARVARAPVQNIVA